MLRVRQVSWEPSCAEATAVAGKTAAAGGGQTDLPALLCSSLGHDLFLQQLHSAKYAMGTLQLSAGTDQARSNKDLVCANLANMSAFMACQSKLQQAINNWDACHQFCGSHLHSSNQQHLARLRFDCCTRCLHALCCQAKPASRAPHFLRRASARGIFCACTFTGGINALEPPYTVFENNPDFKGVYPGKVSDLDLINMCPHPCPLDLNPATTPPHVLEALVDALTLFSRTVRDARISVPPTTVMLENGSTWHAAQLSVAHSK